MTQYVGFLGFFSSPFYWYHFILVTLPHTCSTLPEATAQGAHQLPREHLDTWMSCSSVFESNIITCHCNSSASISSILLSNRDVALFALSACTDHYQLSCLSGFLSFFFSLCEMSLWGPYVALCVITSSRWCKSSSHPWLPPCPALLHCKQDFKVTTPNTADWFSTTPPHSSFSVVTHFQVC